MKIAVIIPTVGRTFFVLNMVMLLQAGTRRPDEIIIVDQTDPSARNPIAFDDLKSLCTDCECSIIEHSVKSLTVARNVGITATDADLLIFVDDDAFIPPHFVEAYYKLFADSSIDAATGMILVSEADNGTYSRTQNRPSEHYGQTMLRGGNFAVRRPVIHAIGGLDENFVGAGNHEDADLAYRLHAHGCKVLWAPRPWLFHLSYAGGGGRIVNPFKHRNFAYNLCYFLLRHRKGIELKEWLTLLRWRVFNRENISRPWLLPNRMRDFISGYRLARAAAVAGPKLPLMPLQSGRS
jgi:glycosyltransferase involved in cell wall biosynthesis